MRVGDKVVCVDDSIGRFTGKKYLCKGEIYTIRCISPFPEGNLGFNLEEVILNEWYFDGTEVAFSDWRFRPVDYNFGEEICESIEESLNQIHELV